MPLFSHFFLSILENLYLLESSYVHGMAEVLNGISVIAVSLQDYFKVGGKPGFELELMDSIVSLQGEPLYPAVRKFQLISLI